MSSNTMDEQIRELYNMPQNQLRKLGVLKSCIKSFEVLRYRHQPAFNEDPFIAEVLQLMQKEHDALVAELRQRPDAMALLEECFKED